LSSPILTKFWISRQIFLNVINMKLHVNRCIGISADTRGQTDRRTDKTKVTGVFREYANTPRMALFWKSLSY